MPTLPIIAIAGLIVLSSVNAQVSAGLGPTRFAARILYYSEMSAPSSGILKYDWESQEQRLDLSVFEKQITEITLFNTPHGVIKVSQTHQGCTAYPTSNAFQQQQDILFVSDDAQFVQEFSSCGDLVLPYASSPSRQPICRLYRQQVGEISYFITWDAANGVVREARVQQGDRLLRRYILLSQAPQTSSFPPETFSPPPGCQGSVFCAQNNSVCVAVDGSESVSPVEFAAAKQFAKRVLESTNVTESCVISFSHSSTVYGPFPQLSDALSALSSLQRRSGLTDLASPLVLAKRILSRSLPSIKSVVLVSDGLSTFQGKVSPIDAAEELRKSSIYLFISALGEIRNASQLATLTYSSSSQYQFSAYNINRLPQLNGTLANGFCDSSVRRCSENLNCGFGFPLCTACLCPSGEILTECDTAPPGGLSAGAIVGIVLGVVLGLALLALAARRLLRRNAAAAVAPAGPLQLVNDNPLYQGQQDHYNPVYQPL